MADDNRTELVPVPVTAPVTAAALGGGGEAYEAVHAEYLATRAAGGSLADGAPLVPSLFAWPGAVADGDVIDRRSHQLDSERVAVVGRRHSGQR